MNQKFMKTGEVAEMLGFSAKTLSNWRRYGSFGPNFYKFGAAVRYLEEDVLEWAASKTIMTEDMIEIGLRNGSLKEIA